MNLRHHNRKKALSRGWQRASVSTIICRMSSKILESHRVPLEVGQIANKSDGLLGIKGSQWLPMLKLRKTNLGLHLQMLSKINQHHWFLWKCLSKRTSRNHRQHSFKTRQSPSWTLYFLQTFLSLFKRQQSMKNKINK